MVDGQGLVEPEPGAPDIEGPVAVEEPTATLRRDHAPEAEVEIDLGIPTGRRRCVSHEPRWRYTDQIRARRRASLKVTNLWVSSCQSEKRRVLIPSQSVILVTFWSSGMASTHSWSL